MSDVYPSVDFFTDQTIAASGNATSVNTLETGYLRMLDIYVGNAGTSTDCTITIKGSPTKEKALEKTVWIFNEGAGGKDGIGIEKIDIPEYIWAVVTNSDTTKTAIITVKVVLYKYL